MRLDDGIQLTPSENSRIKSFALKHGISREEAVSRLAREEIEDRFVVRKHRANVVPFRALKRGDS